MARWSPYDDNGGTTVAVAGEDFCIVAATTRMSTGYSILTREQSMIKVLNDKTVLASAGMQASALARPGAAGGERPATVAPLRHPSPTHRTAGERAELLSADRRLAPLPASRPFAAG